MLPERTVLLARVHAPTWTRLRVILQSLPAVPVRIVGDATSAGEVIASATALKPDVIIAARELDRVPVLPLLLQLRICCPGSRVILFAKEYDLAELAVLARLHLAGYLLWSDLDCPLFSHALAALINGGFRGSSETVASAFLAAHTTPG